MTKRKDDEMAQYIAFLVPETAWDGVDYLYHLIELQPNNLYFAIVNARSMEQARKKYFDEYLYPDLIEDHKYEVARSALLSIFDDHDEDKLIKVFGEIDGGLIWNMITDDSDAVTPQIAIETARKLSEQSLKTLSFMDYEMKIAVSAVEKIIK